VTISLILVFLSLGVTITAIQYRVTRRSK
jgi:hypothetical protein